MKLILIVLASLALSLSARSDSSPDDWSEFVKLSKDKSEGARCRAIDQIKKYKDLRMVRFLMPLMADGHPRVRYRAMRAIGRCTDDKGVEYIATKGLKHRNQLIRKGSAEALGWIKDKKTLANLTAALKGSKPAVRAEICSALGWMRDDSVVPKLIETFEDRDWLVRANALQAIRKLNAREAKPLMEKATGDKAYQVRMEAALAWPWADRDGAVAGLEKLIRDKDWRVRCAAIEACTQLRERACIGWLIDLLAKEAGRLRWDALVVLKDLTGKDLGLEAGNWKGWWGSNKDTFEVRQKGKKGEKIDSPNVGGGTASFFKVPILSGRMIFILDLSGSMRDPGVETDGRKRGLTKLDIAKKEMVRTIESLPPKTKFSIIGLGSTKEGKYLTKKQKTWRKKLRLFRADGRSKKDAVKWVRALQCKGWTNIYDAIEYAYEEPDVDSIYLYTDGGASRGVFTMTSEILTFVQAMNRFRKVVINTVEVPGTKPNTKDNIRLMTELAEKTNGIYELYKSKK